MQIKTEAMKNLKREKAHGDRDHWRKYNKVKTLVRKRGRLLKKNHYHKLYRYA